MLSEAGHQAYFQVTLTSDEKFILYGCLPFDEGRNRTFKWFNVDNESVNKSVFPY